MGAWSFIKVVLRGSKSKPEIALLMQQRFQKAIMKLEDVEFSQSDSSKIIEILAGKSGLDDNTAQLEIAKAVNATYEESKQTWAKPLASVRNDLANLDEDDFIETFAFIYMLHDGWTTMINRHLSASMMQFKAAAQESQKEVKGPLFVGRPIRGEH